MQGNNYQVDKEPLCAIPIVLSDKYQEQLIRKVEDLFDNKATEEEIDELVFDIYNINVQERKIIKEALYGEN